MEGLWWRAAVEASKAVALRGYNVMVAPCELLGGTPKASFSWRSESWGSDGSSGSLCPCNPCTVITAACWHLMLARSAEGLWTAEILLLAWSRIRKLPGLLLSHIPPLRRCRRSWMWSQACMTGQLDGSPPRLQLREVYPDQTWQKVSLKNLWRQIPVCTGTSGGMFHDPASGKSCRSSWQHFSCFSVEREKNSLRPSPISLLQTWGLLPPIYQLPSRRV